MLAVLFFGFVGEVAGHGYLFEPASRQRLAAEADEEFCPHCTLAFPMKAEVSEMRDFPGLQPFAEPGSALSVVKVMEGFSTPFGVCGTQKIDGSAVFQMNDYNSPKAGVWGQSVASYRQGDVVEVSWCDNADHGGVYAYRLCRNADIIEKLSSGATMSPEEQLEAENCFQEGLLRCDDVDENSCDFEPRCEAGWGCSEDYGKYFHCEGTSNYQGKAYACANTERSCPEGVLVVRKVKIPRDFPLGKTIMTWRWDSDETDEVFAACADVDILPGGPTFAPTTTAPTATQNPTQTPTQTQEGGVCCWWSPSADMCSNCQDKSPIGDWCAESEDQCGVCGGTWCAAENGATTEAPVPSKPPSASPTATTCDANAFAFDDAPVESFYSNQNKNRDNAFYIPQEEGCEVTLTKQTWVAFSLPEARVVTANSALRFCFEQEDQCGLHAISPTGRTDTLTGGPIFAISGSQTAWARPLTDFQYDAFGSRQCFEIPLADFEDIGKTYTHIAFINICNTESPEATWSNVEFVAELATPAPTPRYGYAGEQDHCCMHGSCGACYAPIFAPYYCGNSETACTDCAGNFCAGGS